MGRRAGKESSQSYGCDGPGGQDSNVHTGGTSSKKGAEHPRISNEKAHLNVHKARRVAGAGRPREQMSPPHGEERCAVSKA